MVGLTGSRSLSQLQGHVLSLRRSESSFAEAESVKVSLIVLGIIILLLGGVFFVAPPPTFQVLGIFVLLCGLPSIPLGMSCHRGANPLESNASPFARPYLPKRDLVSNCRQCGFQNPVSHMYCRNCGSSLSDETRAYL